LPVIPDIDFQHTTNLAQGKGAVPTKVLTLCSIWRRLIRTAGELVFLQVFHSTAFSGLIQLAPLLHMIFPFLEPGSPTDRRWCGKAQRQLDGWKGESRNGLTRSFSKQLRVVHSLSRLTDLRRFASTVQIFAEQRWLCKHSLQHSLLRWHECRGAKILP
jgi:hypothetical protein